MASWATAEIQGGGIGVGGTLPVLSSVEKRTMVRILWGATDFGTLLLKPSLANQVDKVWRRTSGENGAWPHWPLQETDPALARARVVAFFGLLDGTPPPKRSVHELIGVDGVSAMYVLMPVHGDVIWLQREGFEWFKRDQGFDPSKTADEVGVMRTGNSPVQTHLACYRFKVIAEDLWCEVAEPAFDEYYALSAAERLNRRI